MNIYIFIIINYLFTDRSESYHTAIIHAASLRKENKSISVVRLFGSSKYQTVSRKRNAAVLFRNTRYYLINNLRTSLKTTYTTDDIRTVRLKIQKHKSYFLNKMQNK